MVSTHTFTPELVAEHSAMVERLAGLIRTLIRLGYFSVEVEGAEHLPASGPVVYAGNHAGWFPVDGFMLAFAIMDARGTARAPAFATHEAALTAPVLGPFMRRCGCVPASWFRRPERLPPEIESFGIFPEGWRGNTKPFWEAYRMRAWNRGFVRVAVARGAPIVPVAILGGEECVPVAKTLRLFEPVVGATIGLPLSPLPLPTRWRIVFHEPVRLDPPPGAIADQAWTGEIAARVQRVVQATLDREAASRPLARLSSLVARARGEGASPPSDEVEDPLADPEPARS